MKKRIIYLLMALIPILVLAGFIDNTFAKLKQYNVEMKLNNEEALVRKFEARLVERFANAEQDVVFLATYLGQNLAENETLTTANPQDIKKAASDIFPNLLNHTGLYQEISVLDREGREILSANKDNVNNLELKPLVNKAGEDYFQKVSEHRAGEIYVSFDGKDLRIVSPIYNDAQFGGAVVLTLQKDNFLKEMQAESNDNVMLVEDTGKYILTSRAEPGQDFITDYSLETFDQIKTATTGHLETEQGTLLTYIPLKLDDHQWFLITQVDKGTVTANASALQEQLVIILLGTFAVILGLLGLWSLSYGKALKSEQLSKENTELTNLNSLLQQKQIELEDQAAIVEELYAQLEEENQRSHHQKDILQAIIDSLGAALVMADTSHKTIFHNKVWRQIISAGQAAEPDFLTFSGENPNIDDLIQKVIAEATNVEQVTAEIKQLSYTSKEYYRAELEYLKPQHRYYKISSYPCRASDGQALGRIFLFRDITRYKEIDQLKSELISTVSHELRTPMSSIMGFSELLLTRELSPERTKQYTEVIHEQAERLTKLINDFLDIQRMENGKKVFEKHRIDFRHVVTQAFELFGKLGEKPQVLFEGDLNEPLYVLGDSDKLLQVMSNLLSNAIKYSPQGGQISVVARVQAGLLQINVADHGLGIPEEALPRLFNKFFRVDNDDRREIGGTGLGLAICKEIIEAHQGRIWAESTYGEGSTFKFTLPLVEPVKPIPVSSVNSEIGLPDLKETILIVEDDVDLVDLIETVLKEDGLITYSVNKGEEALDLISHTDFKMIILDINLAGQINGWDVVKALKEKEETAQIPVIISSIYENSQDSLEKGICNYLVKPFKPEQLLNIVHKVMKEKVESTMLMHSGESPDEHVLSILRLNGIKVKELRRKDSILMIMLEGES